ncbi:flagellar hook-filament junction protein FlgL [Alicyclobacillus hesperidum subsp. aegles]|uniref:flagellin N-terminal helical domain-containing protein n=1 Tax=Alicyclobacillus hesperidum TaxID=89784 RepID=UPI0007192B74|nr:flagellin [Alicyclobacillus hesperidum]KRW90855.1 flagellin [Alicyclobacillus tengchongensis]GLG02743.1 flagellar hook-filament junction protein FlgL [Alicyclobacillus hesperidum subsp. aegles]
MRVTPWMEQQQFLYNITNIDTAMQNTQEQLSTGKTLNKASDNPLAVSEDMNLASEVQETSGYLSTISTGLTWMNNTSTALQGIISQLQEVQSDVVQALNSTNMSAGGQQGLADTVGQLIQGIYQTADQRQGNNYIFGGQASQTQPSTYLKKTPSDSPAAVPSGAASEINYQIASGVSVSISVTASDIFLTAPGSSPNLQDTLNSIQADLSSGNHANLQQDLNDLNANLTHVINLNADLGSRIQRFTTAQNQLQQYSTNLTNEKGGIEGADMAQVITQFTTDQTVYTAALQMGAQILLPSLVNYLPNS